MFDVKKFAATQNGHEVMLEFDNKLAFINRLRLHVDGNRLDSAIVWYGTKVLRAPLEHGEIEVRVHSGMYGEPNRPEVKRADGSWADMTKC